MNISQVLPEETTETGTIVGVRDCGTVVQIFIETEHGLLVLAADGNLLRRAEADCGSLVEMRVEFSRSSWGGLDWFSPVDEAQEQQR